MITAKGIPLYNAYFEDSKSKIEIPFGTELKVIYAAFGNDEEGSWYYVEYNEHKGWIKDNGYQTNTQILDINYGFVSNYTASADILLYEDLNIKEKSSFIIKDSKFQVLYSYEEDNQTSWLYVRDANYEGWILRGENVKYEADDEVCIDIVAKEKIDPVEEKEKEDEKEREEALLQEEKKKLYLLK